MTPQETYRQIRRSFPGPDLPVPNGQHICLLYRDDDERFQILARFFSAAIEERHKLLYITDTRSPQDVRRRFAELDVDLGNLVADVRTTTEAYFPTGRFEPEAMCDSLRDLCRRAVQVGFPGCRCSGEMDWATRSVPGAERLIEYEVMLNEVIEQSPFSGICQYDVRLFDGPTILALLEVHPYLLVRGQVLSNPNFVRMGNVARSFRRSR